MSATVGELIWRHRKAHGWTQRQLAARAGLALGYVCSLETGCKQPSRSVVLALTRALTLKAGPRDQLLCAAGYVPDWLAVAADDPALWHELWSLVRDSTHGWRGRGVSA